MAERRTWLSRVFSQKTASVIIKEQDQPVIIKSEPRVIELSQPPVSPQPELSGPQTKEDSPEHLVIKQLTERLDTMAGELADTMNYEVKFTESDSSNFMNGYVSDFPGIDQEFDAAALQRIYGTETWVYSAVTEIAKTISSLPQKLQKKTKVKKTVKNPATGQQEIVEQEIWIDATGEKLFQRFEHPNKWTSKTEWLMLLTIDLMTCGEYFIYLDSDVDLTEIDAGVIDSDNTENPWARLQRAIAADVPIKAMYRIPPPMIKPVPSTNGQYIEGYAMQSDRGVYGFNFAEIIHVKLPNPVSPFRGLSPLVAAFKPVLLDRFSTEHMVRFYKTGARLGGVIHTEKMLNKEQLGRFQRSFESNFTGRRNHHRTLILPPGMKYETIEQNPAETALLDFCRYNREAILSVYHVPPVVVGIMDHANFANAKIQLQNYFQYTIKPLLTFFEEGYSLKNSLMDCNSMRFKFDLSDVEVLKEDMTSLAQAGTAMLRSGLTVNEVRERVWKAPPIKGGDRSYSVAEIDRFEKASGGGIFGSLAAPDADTEKDLTTGDQSALIPVAVGPGKPKKPAACEKCKKEPCECPPTDGKSGGNNSGLADYLKDALSELDAGEIPTPEFIAELVKIFNEQHGIEASKEIAPETAGAPAADSAPAQADIVTTPKLYGFGFTKEKLDIERKSFATKTNPLIEKRHAEVVKWFKDFKAVLRNRLGESIKAFGIRKSLDEDDIASILDLKAYDALVKEYIKQVDSALNEAYKLGYVDTLTTFKFEAPNEDAAKFLSQYGAAEVKYILETTRDQMRKLLEDAFKEEAPIGEVALRIQEKFDEINDGRAMTIARTETLTAVSAGREEKRQDWQEQFPDKKLMKIWVSAEDDKVRPSHVEVDGESVEADETFSNGLKYPREPGGEPEEVINCRCTDITFAEEDQQQVEQTLSTEGEEE